MAQYYHTTKHDEYYFSSNKKQLISFSSSLLDQICRSIDQTPTPVINNNSSSSAMRKKNRSDHHHTQEQILANYQRACIIDKWMDNKDVSQKLLAKSSPHLKKDREGSSCSSSDSSCGGFFSSSETESFPVRTGGQSSLKNHDQSHENIKSKHGNGFLKTKSRALKMYSELKKVKQPISPGGKVAAFLNSLFTAGNMKKHKAASNSPSLKSTDASACSSASSFSRSCLSKTKAGGKLSVRFSAASEECRQRDVDMMRKVEEAAREFLMNYHKKLDQNLDEIENNIGEFEEDFDGESCGSSDLFELDNLWGIHLDERYGGEELPVYQTTNIDQIQTMQMAG